MPVVLGAISTVSWLYASFIGVSRSIAPLMSFEDFVSIYGVLLTVAIVVALVVVRPRVERLLTAKQGERYTGGYKQDPKTGGGFDQNWKKIEGSAFV